MHTHRKTNVPSPQGIEGPAPLIHVDTQSVFLSYIHPLWCKEDTNKRTTGCSGLLSFNLFAPVCFSFSSTCLTIILFLCQSIFLSIHLSTVCLSTFSVSSQRLKKRKWLSTNPSLDLWTLTDASSLASGECCFVKDYINTQIQQQWVN